MPSYIRRIDGVHDATASDVNELQIGIENLANNLVRLPANVATTATSLTAIPAFSIAALANETWLIEWYLNTQCSSTGGMRFAVTAPAGSVLSGSVDGTAASMATRNGAALTTINTAPAVNFNNAAYVGFARVETSLVTGSNAGTIGLSFHSVTAGQTSTILAGSYQIARKVF